MNKEKKSEQEKQQNIKIINLIKSYVEETKLKYHNIAEDCIEIYTQANNLNLVVLIYAVNGHLVVRIPGFIRNVNLFKPEIMAFLLQVMQEVLDIRLEISQDGKSLSACCQHIIEDNTITKKQFDLMMMIAIGVTDDIYPQLMKIIYADSKINAAPDASTHKDIVESLENEDFLEDEDSLENEDELENLFDDSQDRKIN